MNNKIYECLSIMFYLASFIILLFCIDSNIYITTFTKFCLMILVFLFIYISGYIQIKKLNYNKSILKMHIIIYFLIYIIIICTLTLFDEIYGRRGFILVRWNKQLLEQYLKTSFNIIPFKTIQLYICGYLNGIVSFKNFIINIFGNIVAFMPCAIFIPLIFKKINNYYKFSIIIILLVIIIELLQFFTLSGSFDIDDIILNVFGASMMYYIVKKINLNKIFFFEE